VDEAAIERAMKRLDGAREKTDPATVDAILERARAQLETLAETAASLESTLPVRVGEAVQDGLRAEVLPVARHFAEVRGLVGQAIRRLERIEGDLAGERNARVDDLALLVDLVASGWKSVDERLARIEQTVSSPNGGRRLEDRDLSRAWD